jgi:hypothetical protein
MEPFWTKVDEAALWQGDLLPGCLVPVYDSDLGISGTHAIKAGEYDLILLTQSCDLEQRKARLVACCPICSIAEFETASPTFAKKRRWNEVLKGRIEGLHLLASPTNPENNREALVVDFREIYSLPFDYLSAKAGLLGLRWRLRSPYLEHFSQAFARFFMRVGLPSTIPTFP